MNFRQELIKVLPDAIYAGDRLIKASEEVLGYAKILLDTLRRLQEAMPEETHKQLPDQETACCTKEDVRGILSEKTAAGYGGEVKKLLADHGAKRLSELGEEHYADVINMAKEIGNE